VGDGANAGAGRAGPTSLPGAPAGRSAIAASSRVRLILAGLLIVLVIAGVRAVPALRWQSRWAGPLHADATAVVIALEVVLAAMLAALWGLGRRRPKPAWPAAQLRSWLRLLIPGLMIASGATLLRYLRFRPTRRHLPTPAPHGSPRPTRPHGPPVHQFTVSATTAAVLDYTLLALVVLAIVWAAVVLLRRRKMPVDEGLELDADEALRVRDAVEAGRRALTGLTDARMAIIACYLAMEGSLARAGAARGAAETAGELLRRATAAGLLHGDAPVELTALFYRARFSAHDVPDASRTAALAALDSILADLGPAAPGEKSRTGQAAAP
jgi:hypothetical protein